MRYLWFISVLVVSACSVQSPVEDEIGEIVPVSEDSVDVSVQSDSLEYPDQPLPDLQTIIAVSLDSTGQYLPSQSLSSDFSDNNMFRNSERLSYNPIQGRWIHFEGTTSIISLSVDCSQMPSITLTDAALLALPMGTDVEQWMIYHNADFGNQYANIHPIRAESLWGRIHFTDSRYEYDLVGPRIDQRYIFVVRYHLELEELVFTDGTGISNIETIEHNCYPGDGWGLSPS